MKKDGKATCSFNLVNGFFTAFFNGFKELESESEARAAIANLGVVQVRSSALTFVRHSLTVMDRSFDNRIQMGFIHMLKHILL